MSVLVTGGTGFLGRRIVERLLAAGRRVSVLGRTPAPELEARGARFIRASLDDAAAVRAACAGIETIFHTAAKVGVWGRSDDFFRTNVLGTRALLEGCRTHGGRPLHYRELPDALWTSLARDFAVPADPVTVATLRDAALPDAKNPQALNRYSYSINNPLKYVDPSGYLEEFVSEPMTIIGRRPSAFEMYTDADPLSNSSLGNISNGGASAGASGGPNLLGVGFGGGVSSSFSGGGATIVNQSTSPTTTTVTSSTTTTANGGFSHTTTYYNGAPNGTCICGTGGTSGGATTTAAAPGVVNGSSTSFFGNFYSELAHPRPLLPSFSSAISAASRALGAISATLSLSGDTAKTNEQYVIRGGLAAPENLIRGSVQEIGRAHV